MKSATTRAQFFTQLGLRATAIFSFAAILGIANNAGATPVTWNGGSVVPTNNWSDAGNWVGGVAPVGGDSLTFDGSVQPSSNDDLPAGTSIAGITIAATAASTTLAGNSINLTGDLAMNRSTTSTINNALALQNSINIAVPNAGGTFTLGGTVSGVAGAGVTKTGPGLAIYSIAATYPGGTAINGGTLRTGTSGNTNAILGTGTISISNGATLDLRSTSATTFNSDLSLGTGGGIIAVRTNDTFSPASISGSGSLGFTGESANLVMTPTDFKGWNGSLNVFVSGSSTPFGIRLASAYVNNSALSMAINLTTSAAFISKQNGTNGTTVIDIGTLSGVAGSTIGASAAGSGTFIYSVGNRNELSTFAGTIADGSTKTGLRKVGTQTLQLTGANTYTGATQVNGGELQVGVAGVGSLGNTAVTVNTTGILGGTGSIAGTVSSVGGTIAPGDSPGTLTISNTLTSDANTIFAYDLNGGDNTPGAGINDLINSVINLTLDGTLNITESVANSFSTAVDGTKWRLINYSGALTDNTLTIGSFPTLPADGSLSIDTSTTGQVNLLLSVVSVPEPSSLVLLGFAGMAFVSVGRRARRKVC
jgi:autotransporter-associated beta strand protein